MVINQSSLVQLAPIKNMLDTKVQEHGVSHGLSEVGYDIQVKQRIHFYPNDPWNRGPSVSTTEDNKFGGLDQTTKPGRFVITSAMEEFEMPNNLMGVVHDKSTWARRGLSVFNTVIEPGWKGFLTLELVYHGAEELIIPEGSGIAQVIFHQISNPAAYNGKYQNQEDRPVEAIFA